MKSLHKCLAVIAVAASFWGAPLYAATVTFYNDLTTFQAATTTTLIDFEGIVADADLAFPGTSAIIDGVTFSVPPAAPGSDLVVIGKDAAFAGSPFNSALLGSNSGGDAPITADLTSAGSGFTAVGGFFGNTAFAGFNTTMTLLGTSGVLDIRVLSADLMGFGDPHSFYGWTVQGDTIVSIEHDLEANFEGLDDFRYGTVISTPIPPPVWLFGSGLLGLVGLGRKRRK